MSQISARAFFPFFFLFDGLSGGVSRDSSSDLLMSECTTGWEIREIVEGWVCLEFRSYKADNVKDMPHPTAEERLKC